MAPPLVCPSFCDKRGFKGTVWFSDKENQGLLGFSCEENLRLVEVARVTWVYSNQFLARLLSTRVSTVSVLYSRSWRSIEHQGSFLKGFNYRGFATRCRNVQDSWIFELSRLSTLGKDEGFVGTTRISCIIGGITCSTITAYDIVIKKKAYIALILCLGDQVLWEITKETTATGIWKKLETLYMTKSLANRLYLNKKLYTFHMHLGKSQFEHIDEFYKLEGDLAAIDTTISDEDQTLLLLTSLPSSYDNFMETLLYGRDTLKLEDGEIWSERCVVKVIGKKQQTQASGSGADAYDIANVMMAMSVEELLNWIMDSGGSYYITYRRDYFVNFEEYDGGNILLGDGREFRV
ncbi:hypothetical protein Tco_0924922 [Tanacetum coccineum]|uniref:Retrovirus-related Pol polyprotein from transposon TNT 1-94-like beta-barrel domain-containing protein n=1 Tax=Tanacetum coccineum TaxID=301880 RepID=A0ABQ5D7E0_9ASTR